MRNRMTLLIDPEWQDQSLGSLLQDTEDKVCLAKIRIKSDQTCFTNFNDNKTNEILDGVNLSAYRLAEWLIWNWWRLRWEPPRQGPRNMSWDMSHNLSCIGDGWLWPNIVVKSDGYRIVLGSSPSEVVPTEPLNYNTKAVTVVPCELFEETIDNFVICVIKRLDKYGCNDTDLHLMWEELKNERNDADFYFYRRIEAYLGFDPDGGEVELIKKLIEESKRFGQEAVSEIVADDHSYLFNLDEDITRCGFDIRPNEGVQKISTMSNAYTNRGPAWSIGEEAARQLRSQEKLGTNPIPNEKLAELFGISKKDISKRARKGKSSFVLNDKDMKTGRVVLRSSWQQGRRFTIARLLADRLLIEGDELLHPATAASTYRQSVQRAFAGEFLCPIESLTDFLNGDFSQEKQQDAAEHFNVSAQSVTLRLVDYGYLDREELQNPDLSQKEELRTAS